MVSLKVIVLDVLTGRGPEVTFTEQHDAVEAILLDGTYEAPGTVWAAPDVLAGNELSVAAQDGVGRSQGRRLPQSLAAKRPALHREPATLRVREAQTTSTELLAQGAPLRRPAPRTSDPWAVPPILGCLSSCDGCRSCYSLHWKYADPHP
jgi:hypothetical protein